MNRIKENLKIGEMFLCIIKVHIYILKNKINCNYVSLVEKKSLKYVKFAAFGSSVICPDMRPHPYERPPWVCRRGGLTMQGPLY